MKDMVDVCVIGAGPCGAVVAKEIREKGHSVVVLEAGPRWNPREDFVNDEVGSRRLHWPDPRTYAGDNPVQPKTATGLGGTSLIWQAVCLRFKPSDFLVRQTNGVADDWPLTYEQLAPYYSRVEDHIGVAGSPNSTMPPHPLSWAAQLLAKGCDDLGVPYRVSPVAINSVAQQGRPGCVHCGYCTAGCMVDAKATAANTYLPWAEKAGARVLPRSFVTRVNLDLSQERVRSVSYVDGEGQEHEQPCRALVLAAGVIETSRLLLNSTSGRFPHGLANTSGLVGCYFTVHPTRPVYGRFRDRVDGYRGFDLGAVVVDTFQEGSPKNDFARGYVFESLQFGPVHFALTHGSAWGSSFKTRFHEYNHHVGWWIIGEGMPLLENRVEVDPDVRDRRGLPVAKITHRWDANDLKIMEAATKQGVAMLEAAGVEDVLAGPISGAHLSGTCRMGDDPKRSVVNARGQSHDVPNLFVADGSVFVTDSSANVTLTSMAVANHVADSLMSLASAGDL